MAKANKKSLKKQRPFKKKNRFILKGMLLVLRKKATWVVVLPLIGFSYAHWKIHSFHQNEIYLYDLSETKSLDMDKVSAQIKQQKLSAKNRSQKTLKNLMKQFGLEKISVVHFPLYDAIYLKRHIKLGAVDFQDRRLYFNRDLTLFLSENDTGFNPHVLRVAAPFDASFSDSLQTALQDFISLDSKHAALKKDLIWSPRNGFYVSQEGVEYLFGHGNLSLKLSRFHKILDQASQDGKTLAHIDLSNQNKVFLQYRNL